MGIKLKSNITKGSISKMTEAAMQRFINAAIQALGMLGMKCVNYARTIPKDIGYTDRTGNLRSSTGFKVFYGGKVVKEDYKLVLNGQEGLEKGRSLADSIGEQCGDNQIMLVVTAGMEYAVYLESNNHEVLTTTEQFAEREWPAMKQRIDEMFRRMA